MVTKISDLSQAQVASVLALAHKMKANPKDYFDALNNETLLMLFEKPSLRTRVSLEVGMTEMGGHAISYMIGDSPLGKKETYGDTGACLSRYVAAITARVTSREQINGLTATADVPVVNALDDWAHPMQMLADLQTIEEKFGSLKGLRMAYLGDIRNNVTYDLMRSGALMGFTVAVAGPKGPDYELEDGVVAECEALAAANGGAIELCETAAQALAGADIVYTDSWQSYGIKQTEERIAQLMPFQVTKEAMAQAKPNAVFMNCLPALRGEEQTAEVIDGEQSIVFDQAENRLHAQKALLYLLIKREL
jgi:ornithine carbamoyltransferase